MLAVYLLSLAVIVDHALLQPDTIMNAVWPTVGEVDKTLLRESDYLTTMSHEFRVRLRKMMDMKGKVGLDEIGSATLYSMIGGRSA